MASSNPDASGSIYKWIERKPLTEAVAWTSREKFWLITAVCNYGIHDWKSVAQVVRNSGEPYRPREWYTTKSCERQFKIILSSYSKEIKMPFNDMLRHIAESLKFDYIRDANRSKDNLKAKYCSLFSVLNRVKQGNLSRQEIVSLYSHAKRNEIEGKQYVDQLMRRQTANLATENLNSSLSEEPIKWNTPSAPLLTSLLRSRNTIPANRTVTTIASLLQSPGGTSRTRSGKLLPLSTSVRTQGTPTLSKLLEAPANPYIPSPIQSVQKTKQIDVGTDKVLIGNTSRKENLQSATLNRVQIDNITSGSVNRINKSDLSHLKRQIPKSTVSSVNNGSKENLNVVDLLSDSENEDDNTNSFQNIHPKNLFGEMKETVIIPTSSNCNILTNRFEPRSTRSQTRAESGFKQFNDCKLSDMRKERDNLQHPTGGSQLIDTNLIVEDELIDIDQIEIEPLSLVHDELLSSPPKVTRSFIQRSYTNSSGENVLTTKVKNKEISNQMLEEISANFVLNSSKKNVATDYKNILIGQSRIDNSNITGSLFPVDDSTVTDTILLCKDGQSFLNPDNILDKTLSNKRIIELKGTNIRCEDGRSDTKMLSFNNQPIVVLNKTKSPLLKLTSEEKDKTNDNMLVNIDLKKPTQLPNSSQNVVHLFDGGHCSLSDEVIIIDDDVNIINDDGRAIIKTKESSINDGSKNLPSAAIEVNDSSNSGNSKSSSLYLDEKRVINNKPWKMFGKTQNILHQSSRKPINQDTVSKIVNSSNVSQTSNRFIKELDFDFDHSISQTSLSELYNGVEEIVEEMPTFDNEELNSLIECGSLDNSGTEVHQNIINLDQGDCSVSGSDSTIGAFDTFAQITGVSQKSSLSKDVKFLNRKPKITSDDRNLDFVEGFVQSGEIDDDQISAVSVTGIPILQGVISDVMSKIDSDRVATAKQVVSQNISSDEIVEISSDEEEEIVKNPIQFSLNKQNKSEEHNKELKINKLQELESTYIIDLDNESEPDTIGTKSGENTISNEINNFVIVHTPDMTNFNSKLANSNIVKEDNLSEARMESPELNILKGPLKLSHENIGENSTKVTRNILSFESKLCKKVKENNKNEDEEKTTNNSNTKKATENELESEFIKISNKTEVERVKETMLKDEFEAEIIQRANKKNEIKKLIEAKKLETKRVREAELIKRAKEIEVIKAREAELKKAKEAEIQRSKEAEIKRAKEAEIRAKEIEILKAKEVEIQKAKEVEIQKAKEVEIQKAKEVEIQKAKEVEIQKAKEVELQKAKEMEIQRAKEAEILRAKELEIQKAKEIEMREKEAEIARKKKEEELQRIEEETRQIKEIEIRKKAIEEEARRIKENDLKKAKEAELKRIKDAEMKKAKEEADLKKAKEIELKKTTELLELKIKEENIVRLKEADLRKRKDLEVKEADILKKSQESKINRVKINKEVELKKRMEDGGKKIIKENDVLNLNNQHNKSKHQVSIDPKQYNVKEIKTEHVKLKESKKSVEIVLTKKKEVVIPTYTKMITRRRGSRNVNDDDCRRCSCCSDDYSSKKSKTSNNNFKKRTTNVDNKRINLTSNSSQVCDSDTKSKGNSSKVFCQHNTKNSAKLNISDKSRTRSSSIKLGKINWGNKVKFARKSNCPSCVPASTLKPNIPKKNIASTDEIPFPSGYNCQNSIELIKKEASKTFINKELKTIPVVIVNTNEVTEYRERLAEKYALKNAEKNDSSKKLDPKIVNNEKFPKKIDDDEKAAPKKRGRKRRIDVENERLQQSTKDNRVFKNGQLSKSFEPPIKRTRRNTACETEKYFFEDLPNSILGKNVLKLVLKNICETNKYLNGIQMEVKDLSGSDLSIIKNPIELQDIRKKINTGKIKTISQLQTDLLLMTCNAVIANRSDSIIMKVAKKLKNNLDFNRQNPVVKTENTEDVQFPILNSSNKKKKLNLSNFNEDCYRHLFDEVFHGVKHSDEFQSFSNTPEASDTECDGNNMPPKKRRRKNEMKLKFL